MKDGVTWSGVLSWTAVGNQTRACLRLTGPDDSVIIKVSGAEDQDIAEEDLITPTSEQIINRLYELLELESATITHIQRIECGKVRYFWVYAPVEALIGYQITDKPEFSRNLDKWNWFRDVDDIDEKIEKWIKDCG
jgi:hypothetical protein